MSTLPFGTIVMYSGSSIPDGWLLCDGSKNTPNLIDKFILGGKIDDIGGIGGGVLSGDKNNKSVYENSSEATSNVSVNVQDTVLTIEQIPEHSHSCDVTIDSGTNNDWWAVEGDDSSSQKYQGVGIINKWNIFPINSTGGGEGHTHDIEVSDNKHSHKTNVISPYYILAYIIYTG
ncbi:tail fiber protein [Enterobacter cancerogenus]|uniref:tail fiber protein n=1 Tax=Enterobacter cancerogenus TaxID=69218 RepID=UPI0040594C4C